MFEELMELEERANNLEIEVVKVREQTKEYLDWLQGEYIETTRRLNDIDHLIELGENLSRSDVMGLFELRRDMLLHRREIKETLGCYIPSQNLNSLFNNGNLYLGEYSRYRTPPKHENSYYSLRSDSEKDSRINDYMDAVSFSDEKFSGIAREVSKEMIEKLRVFGTL